MVTPPKVMPVLQVGVSGHRNLAAAELKAIEAALRDVMAGLEAGAKRALAGGWPGVENATVEFRCVSALAEGTDQLAARAALERGWSLAAPLPFAREVYRNELSSDAAKAAYDALLTQAASVYELDGVAGNDLAYQALGRLILEQSDILVAVWDGEPERGPGGTAELVREARAAAIPVVVIAAAAPHRISLFAAQDMKAAEDAAASILSHQHKAGKELSVYYRESKYDAPRVASRLAAMERVLLLGAQRKAMAPPAEPQRPEPLDEAIERVRFAMEPHLQAADTLAVRYAVLYRASVSLRYLAALPAILASLIIFYEPPPYGLALGFVAQIIAAITFLIGYNDKRAGWQRRFTDYRYMAERLRYAPLMAMFGSTGALPRLTPIQKADDSDWANWYLHFAVRGIGLVRARRDPAFIDGLRRLLGRLIDEQIAYFSARAADATLLASRLQKAGLVIFAIGISFAFLGGSLNLLGAVNGRAYGMLLGLSAVMGSLWPAIFGLRSQREYQRLSERYEAMVRRLRQTENWLARDGAVHGQVERIARDVVDAMLTEVSDWRVLIKSRTFGAF